MAFPWTCPFCNHDVTIGPNDYEESTKWYEIENKHGKRSMITQFIVCPNPECKEYTLTTSLHHVREDVVGRYYVGDRIETWSLIPSHNAKIFPDYIPKAIIEDYVEACKIKDLSPKASATLARRCLQGIIRDFWGVSKGRLVDEIDAIKDKVDPLTWDAIDAVRKIGNIGAHMEKDINLIIEVEPNEAQKLIELIELLLEEWYVHRHERQERLKAIKEISSTKDAAKNKTT